MRSEASQVSLMEMKIALLKQTKPEEMQGKRKMPTAMTNNTYKNQTHWGWFLSSWGGLPP
jgi:hypothetical protein